MPSPETRRTVLQKMLMVSLGLISVSLEVSCGLPESGSERVARLSATANAAPTTSAVATTPEKTAAPTSTGIRKRTTPQSNSVWQVGVPRQTIKGFLDKVSAAAGETVALYVTTPAPSFYLEVYRLGWYNGGSQQAQFVEAWDGLSGTVQPEPVMSSETGLISAANWTRSSEIKIDGWKTGLYLFKLIASDGDQNYVPLVVRDDAKAHDILFVQAANTDQAYNDWGGKSLYDYNSKGGVIPASGGRQAVKVSFDRPYSGSGDSGPGRNISSWELNMIRWMESAGFDVGYTSDVDIHANPLFEGGSRAVIMAGHNEYWSTEMRDHLEAVRDRKKGLGFFTGDTGGWVVRFEDSKLGRNRVMVCYKDAGRDPLSKTDPTHTTVRPYQPPYNRPMHQFLGVASNAAIKTSADWTVTGVAAEPSLFAGTGFTDGDLVPALVGYEYDGMWTPGSSQPPKGLQVLGKATVFPLREESPTKNRLKFVVRRTVAPPVSTGILSARIGSRNTDVWRVYVHVSGSGKSVYLQYDLGDGTPAPPTEAEGTTYAFYRLGSDMAMDGWHDLRRDLRDDYSKAFGKAPDDMVVDRLLFRGSVAVAQLSLTDPQGRTISIFPAADGAATSEGWQVADGQGALTVENVAGAEKPALVLTEELPAAKEGDAKDRTNEAHTVMIHEPQGNLLFAAGTIQWSWALDDFGSHTDAAGNVTKVDPRMQRLTKNILVALSGKG